MSSEIDYDRVLQLRSEIINEIQKDVVGPREEDELIPTSPSKKYLSGVLYPQQNVDTEFEPEKKMEANSTTENNEPDEIDEKANRTSYPSSMGLTCKVKGDIDEIKLEIEYAKYHKSGSGSWGPFQRTPIKNSENKIISIPIKLIEGISKPEPIGDNTASINYHIRNVDGDFLVSVFLRNNLPQLGVKQDPTQCIYQPVIRLLSKNSTDEIFKDTSAHDLSDEDASELQLYKLLFRHRKQFGIGHSCSVTWNSKNVNDFTNIVETTFMPQYEVPKIASNDNDREINKLQALDMKFLADVEDFSDYEKPLLEIYDLYGVWIKKLTTPTNFEEIAEIQIEECEKARERIKKGISLVSSNKEIGEVFRFANRVMLYQRSYSDWAKLSKEDKKILDRKKPELKGKWRLFQLAFILLNIESLSDVNSKERKIADVLWFPTAGGKTEAYLGIIAFTIGLRRFRNKGIFKYGVTALMRYTLRLLTLQQFQRATAFMCACEIIRKADRNSNGKSKWGSEPFSVGLWLGVASTPNTLKGDNGAKAQLKKAKQSSENVRGSNPYQIRSCPWCGDEILPDNYDFGGQIEHMRIFCSNKNCEFSRKKSKEEVEDEQGKKFYEERGLPVFLIDEDIYNLCPTLIIATVDKFAQISWNWKTASIFGKIDKFSTKKGFITSNNPDPPSKVINLKTKYGKDHLLPPELIIQDELHLISGPLGTLTSLYETAIDDLCTTDESFPKIIASTATTKNSPEQIKRLFNIPRNQVKIFPPQGFVFGDSFFAKEISTDEEFGKIYLGVCPTSRTGLTILARVAAVILQTVRAYKYEGKYTDDELDPYFTVVSYFNSIKELANANRVFDDSVPDFMRMIQNKYDIVESEEDKEVEDSTSTKFYVPNLFKDELTSRKDANEIPEILKLLDVGLTTGNGTPLDVLLCTNMIQVGVDVDRFGTMIINGQPKQTSEYIQASGRIGRKYPGLIIASYNYLKPRDLSHYENFLYYHSTFHQYVEPVSITPFSPRARDRGLLGVVVGLMRLNSNLLSNRNSAHNFEINSSFQPLIDRITNFILERVSNIDPTETQNTKTQLQRKIFEFWDKRSTIHKNLHFDKNPYPFAREDPESKYLMKTSVHSIDKESILVPTSLREAEDEVKLKYYSKKFKGEDDE